MSRQVDTHKLPLAVEPLQCAPFAALGNLGLRNLGHLRITEQRCAGVGLVGLVEVAVSHKCLEELVATAVDACVLVSCNTTRQLVECSGICQALKVLAVAGGEVHTLHEVEYACERAVCLALVNDALHGVFAHALHGAQAETYVALLVHAELAARLVHVGAEYVDAHALALLHQLGDFGNLVKVSAHGTRHVL